VLGTVQANWAASRPRPATADAATRTDIVDKLFAKPPALFVHGFDRPNLRLSIRAKAGGRKQIVGFLEGRRGRRASSIVRRAVRRRSLPISSAAAASERCRIMPD
jgi:ATP-dependent DNA helicase RecQ